MLNPLKFDIFGAHPTLTCTDMGKVLNTLLEAHLTFNCVVGMKTQAVYRAKIRPHLSVYFLSMLKEISKSKYFS